jgi:hypothetical protein
MDNELKFEVYTADCTAGRLRAEARAGREKPEVRGRPDVHWLTRRPALTLAVVFVFCLSPAGLKTIKKTKKEQTWRGTHGQQAEEKTRPKEARLSRREALFFSVA